MKIDTVIFDIDGVLSLSDHRQFCLDGETKDWDRFYSMVELDDPNEPMIKLLDMFYWVMDYEIVLLTSRPVSNRELTTNWLSKVDVTYNELIMRPDGNYDHQWKVKCIKEMKTERNIWWIFEDSPKEIALFQELNWPVIPIAGVDYGTKVFENLGGE